MGDRLQELIDQERALVVGKPRIDAESIPKWQEDGQEWTFHEGQLAAWGAKERDVAIIAGSRSGKSRVGAHLFLREIQRTAKPRDVNCYAIVGPDLEILKKGPLIIWDQLLALNTPQALAEYKTVDRCYVFTPYGCEQLCGFKGQVKVFLGYAHKPSSLQAATYKAIWADECGQDDFMRESHEALLLRGSVHNARNFYTTTPYALDGWLREIVDEKEAGGRPDLFLIRFKSTANPRFSQEQYDRLCKEMPPWRAKMFLDGDFSIPEGAIYDCFSDENLIEDEKFIRGEDFVPDHWPRHLSMDFGQVNTCAGFYAEAQEDRVMGSTLVKKGDLVCFGDYLTGGRTAKEHAGAVSRKGLGLFRSPKSDYEQTFDVQVGGTWSEDEWRNEYIAAGLEIARPPSREVEVGIDRVYRLIRSRSLKFFKDAAKRTVSDIRSYRRELDKRGEVSEKIHRKETHHFCDQVRYLCLFCRPIEAYEPPEKEFSPAKGDEAQFSLNKRILEMEDELDARQKAKVGRF